MRGLDGSNLTAVIETLQQKLNEASHRSLLSALLSQNKDFVWFGGPTSRWTIVPLGLEDATWSEFSAKKISPSYSSGSSAIPFSSGYIGVIPYEEFSPFDDGPAPLLMQARGALLCNNETGACSITARSRSEIQDIKKLAGELLNRKNDDSADQKEQITLTPKSSDDQYELMVQKALSDIGSGRYYQINLLRYFLCGGITRKGAADLLLSRGGPYACWVSQGDTEVISFSPEHFVEIVGSSSKRLVSTSPIKGTSPRYQDPTLDQKSANDLMTSKKNLAELHMIIDLMRNDLNRICIPGTVEVKDANRLVSFVNVHHLVGSVIGQLREGLTVKDLLTALCPGGSITGAPKIEVMLAIREYEQRPRGYFMGHAFMLDDTGTFNSSILIRTLQKQSGKDYEFSAGSGIVIHSDPKSERLEIDAKCKVLKR